MKIEGQIITREDNEICYFNPSINHGICFLPLKSNSIYYSGGTYVKPDKSIISECPVLIDDSSTSTYFSKFPITSVTPRGNDDSIFDRNANVNQGNDSYGNYLELEQGGIISLITEIEDCICSYIIKAVAGTKLLFSNTNIINEIPEFTYFRGIEVKEDSLEYSVYSYENSELVNKGLISTYEISYSDSLYILISLKGSNNIDDFQRGIGYSFVSLYSSPEKDKIINIKVDFPFTSVYNISTHSTFIYGFYYSTTTSEIVFRPIESYSEKENLIGITKNYFRDSDNLYKVISNHSYLYENGNLEKYIANFYLKKNESLFFLGQSDSNVYEKCFIGNINLNVPLDYYSECIPYEKDYYLFIPFRYTDSQSNTHLYVFKINYLTNESSYFEINNVTTSEKYGLIENGIIRFKEGATTIIFESGDVQLNLNGGFRYFYLVDSDYLYVISSQYGFKVNLTDYSYESFVIYDGTSPYLFDEFTPETPLILAKKENLLVTPYGFLDIEEIPGNIQINKFNENFLSGVTNSSIQQIGDLIYILYDNELYLFENQELVPAKATVTTDNYLPPNINPLISGKSVILIQDLRDKVCQI